MDILIELLISVLSIFRSPIGPSAVLFLGACVQAVIGRTMNRGRQALPDQSMSSFLTGLALIFVGGAIILWLLVGTYPANLAPIYQQQWQPLLQGGASLYWVSDGWNWCISGLILLIGGIGILINLNAHESQRARFTTTLANHNVTTILTVYLGLMAAALLFVNSGNLLTVILTWVIMDILVMVRGSTRMAALTQGAGLSEFPLTKLSMDASANGIDGPSTGDNPARGLSLIGAILLLIGLLPAGPTGVGQFLNGGTFYVETVILMLLAAIIRTGVYPFHLWLLPEHSLLQKQQTAQDSSNILDSDGDFSHANRYEDIDLAERLMDQIVPVLTGLWFMGWTLTIGHDYIVAFRVELAGIWLLMLVASAMTAWTSEDRASHIAFVLITHAGIAGLVGILSLQPGPERLLWPTMAFALGGSLWLVGGRIWEAWGWQLPVSVGALALTGIPFTPGFLSQPALAQLLVGGVLFLPLFIIYVATQTLQVASLLRSWGVDQPFDIPLLRTVTMVRLLIASFAIGLPLAVTGFLPAIFADTIEMQNAIPDMLGTPPSVVADFPIWIVLVLPLILGMILAVRRYGIWDSLGHWGDSLNRFMRLEWLFRFGWWGVNRLSFMWGNALHVIEGAGYIGWLLVFLLFVYLLS
ncbi:MAG: hypothetical protein AAF639_06370 [Chloroflexota bacterium]